MPFFQSQYSSCGCLSRLEDLDASGCWTREHSVQIGGETIPRAVGQQSRGVLREWRKLRETYGVAGREQFKSLRVWGQPAAWADSIIQCWVSDLLAEYVPQAVVQVDCFSGAWSPVALQTAWWNMQLQIPIAPDVTSILQLADVTVIAPAKQAAEVKKKELQLLLQESSRREKSEYRAKFGKYEIFEVACHMARHQSVLQKTRDVVLSAAVTTQLLAVRPDATGALVRVANTPPGGAVPQ